MCGIAGIIGRPDRDAIQRMTDAMSRRGPDDSGVHVDSLAALGHRRLSIIDLSPAGHQPMSRADGRLWIVYNGEVYNFAALRRDLEARGHRFVSRSDTEVILALYEESGPECVARLRGMFAFAIWDRRGPEPLLLLARDHFGIKPLLYSLTSDGLVFASDTAGLLASDRVPRDIDPVAAVQYLMHGHVVQPRTIYAGVSMLPPAHLMTCKPGQAPQIRPYWRLEAARSASLSRGLDFEAQAARLRGLLEEAARAQMVSDVPLGAFLSGGVDSSTLVALMTRVSGRPVHTYSVGFPDAGAALDESGDARRSALHLGAVHTAVDVGGAQVASMLPGIAAALGQPTIDGVNMYFVSEAARRGVTVALSGLGGDELFAGYATFTTLAARDAVATRLRRAAARALRVPTRWATGEDDIARAWRDAQARHGFAADYMSFHMVRSPQDAWALAGRPAVQAGDLFAYLDADDPTIDDPTSRVTRLETALYMNSQLLRDTDAASMAHSLEVRVPLLDVDVAEFAFGLPADSKIGALESGGPATAKRVLLRAAGELIPDWTWRKPKRGFTLPFGEWLRGPLRPLAEDAFGDPAFAGLGWLDAAAARREWRRFLNDPSAHWSVVWTTLMLALWSGSDVGPARSHPAGRASHDALPVTVQGVH